MWLNRLAAARSSGYSANDHFRLDIVSSFCIILHIREVHHVPHRVIFTFLVPHAAWELLILYSRTCNRQASFSAAEKSQNRWYYQDFRYFILKSFFILNTERYWREWLLVLDTYLKSAHLVPRLCEMFCAVHATTDDGNFKVLKDTKHFLKLKFLETPIVKFDRWYLVSQYDTSDSKTSYGVWW